MILQFIRKKGDLITTYEISITELHAILYEMYERIYLEYGIN